LFKNTYSAGKIIYRRIRWMLVTGEFFGQRRKQSWIISRHYGLGIFLL